MSEKAHLCFQNFKDGKKNNRDLDIMFNLHREREKPKTMLNLHSWFAGETKVELTQSVFVQLSLPGVRTFLSQLLMSKCLISLRKLLTVDTTETNGQLSHLE